MNRITPYIIFFIVGLIFVGLANGATLWTQQSGVLNKYKLGSQEKYLPTTVLPGDVPKNYVKQSGQYFQCISDNNAKRYVTTDLDCYRNKLKAEIVYCPVEFCIARDGGMAMFTNSATYGDCDRLYFNKEKLVSVYDSTKENLNYCQ